MNHNYKLTDFKLMNGEIILDVTDITANTVFFEFEDIPALPDVIITRLLNKANELIAEHEQKNNMVLSLDDMELGGGIEVRKESGELVICHYIGGSLDKNHLQYDEVIKPDDKDYILIKKVYFDIVNNFVLSYIKQLEDCLQ